MSDRLEVSGSASSFNFIVKTLQEQIENQMPMTADRDHFLYLHVINKAIEDYLSSDPETRASAERYFFRRFDKQNDIFEIHAALVGSDPDWIRYELKKAREFKPKLDKLLDKIRGRNVTRREINELLASVAA